MVPAKPVLGEQGHRHRAADGRQCSGDQRKDCSKGSLAERPRTRSQRALATSTQKTDVGQPTKAAAAPLPELDAERRRSRQRDGTTLVPLATATEPAADTAQPAHLVSCAV